jgi:hypothetical protein
LPAYKIASSRSLARNDDILETEITTATRIAEHIFARGKETVDRPDDIRAWIKAMTYKPVYGAWSRSIGEITLWRGPVAQHALLAR